MGHVSHLFNRTVLKDIEFDYNLTKSFHNDYIKSAPVELIETAGLVTGILITLCINIILSFENRDIFTYLKFKFQEFFNIKTVLRIIALIILILVLPFVVTFLLLALLYKTFCSGIIRNKDKDFVEFLDSFDVFWSLEDDASKSIINVLGVIEGESSEKLVRNIKDKLQSILSNGSNSKMFFRRSEKYGFYYWRKCRSVDMKQYIQIVDYPDQSDKLDTTNLENIMTKISNLSLPYNDEGLFKIVITKQRIGNYDKVKGEYGIIFKIHHSLGDGVALIEFLCETFADKEDNCPVYMFPIIKSYNYTSVRDLLDMIRTLYEIPLCFIDGIIRKPDDNALHGPSLWGKKIYTWMESDEDLLKMIHDIKDNMEQYKFSDILVTALSGGLTNYFSKTMAHVPDDVAVILPVRFPKLSSDDCDIKLENDFSVTILDLPTKQSGKINEIKKRCDQLRKSADPLTNYYFLKLVAGILPKYVLLPLLNSSQATMVFSSLPGPQCLSICGGNALKKIVFFVPHKGSTGLGVTALCYGGVLRFGAMADAALVPDSRQLSFILDGMVDEIKRLHQQYVTH